MDERQRVSDGGRFLDMELDEPTSRTDLPKMLGHANRAGALIAAGMPPSHLRQPYWRRPWHGVARLVGHDEAATSTRVLDAVALLPPGCALGGWASQWWQGVPYADGRDGRGRELPIPLHMTSGHQLRRRPGIAPTRADLAEGEIVEVDGVLVSTLPRATFDAMCQLDTVTDAVIVADMATSRLLGHRATAAEDITAVWLRRRHVRGRTRVGRALISSCDRSLSPWETRLRLFATEVLAVREWCVNAPVFDVRGHLAGVVDLLDLSSGLALESDGAQHRATLAHAADNVRGETYSGLRLVVVRVTAPDWTDRGRLRHRLVVARRRSLDVPVADRLWTSDKPAWWWGSRAAQHWE